MTEKPLLLSREKVDWSVNGTGISACIYEQN